ncbi:unnamed protein product [Arabis nemorensis]|uniref:Peptidoglycan binding-like domain-containing protein n=1 Tax=Arabis nemorensis TaxID=586526 RepID=A0A565BK54_9BRAS|nr:unnamed protein product [Arabis nemorensis]
MSFHKVDKVIFGLQFADLIGAVNRPKVWPSFSFESGEILKVLRSFTRWKFFLEIKQTNRGAFLIALNVIKEDPLFDSSLVQNDPIFLIVALEFYTSPNVPLSFSPYPLRWFVSPLKTHPATTAKRYGGYGRSKDGFARSNGGSVKNKGGYTSQGTSIPDSISNVAALLQVLKEKNRILESGSSVKPMVLENTREPGEEVEEEEEKRVISEEKFRVSEPLKKRRTLKVGSEGEEVQALQEALLKLGFYSGEEDMEFSSFSSGTASAVKTWQASLGIREDGIMTAELLQRLFMDQKTDEDTKTEKDEASTMKQEEAGNGAVKTQVSEQQQSIIKDPSDREVNVSQHRVFLLGENRWEDPSRLNKPVDRSKSTDTKTKCITCRGEGRLMCLECDGTGEPNIEPQFMEWIGEDTKCAYCEGLGYTVCDVCDGKTTI